MKPAGKSPIEALLLALPETAGSALYGMIDVLTATGTLWHEFVRDEPGHPLIRPRVVAQSTKPFRCGNGIPVRPDIRFADAPAPKLLILPEMWLSPSDDLHDRYEDLKHWLRSCYSQGSTIYSACSGSVLLAASGLLDGKDATSHWGYQDLFRASFPAVRFDPSPALVIADPSARIVTAGGASSWHDLALHIIARHCNSGVALRVAKVYLLKWHSEGQLPFQSLVRRQPHADSVVRRTEEWLSANFCNANVVAGAVAASGIPERTLKRRFKTATGEALMAYAQNLRIEEAKRLLESQNIAADDIAALIGYENPAFFRRLFKRFTGLTPGAYRRMFQPIGGELNAAIR
ncbi:MAG: helix-turn-helix domain-containing protein [Hyphomicrobium sp.]|nr:helix-turn-helix domain-containing protein [Hyphomicrobium sp.]